MSIVSNLIFIKGKADSFSETAYPDFSSSYMTLKDLYNDLLLLVHGLPAEE
jgi:hypothetical protein